MNRPYLVNISAINSSNKLSIRLSVSQSNESPDKIETPFDNISLLSKDIFRILIIGRNHQSKIIYSKEFETDNFGNFNLVTSTKREDSSIEKIEIYETSCFDGVSIHLGNYVVQNISSPKKILITDFDKTLVDTKYSTPKEMYYSLNRPTDYFPTIKGSLEKVQNYSQKNFDIFVLSASPHFYEKTIRNWLYTHQIYTSNIYLKEYRDFISIFDGHLTFKDIKKQGFYKLNQLIDILIMTGIPNELVLMGDGFESDPIIYIALNNLLSKKLGPRDVWKDIKNHSAFKLTYKQSSQFLLKFNQLSEMVKKSENTKVKIYIRTNEKIDHNIREKDFSTKSLQYQKGDIEFYLA